MFDSDELWFYFLLIKIKETFVSYISETYIMGGFLAKFFKDEEQLDLFGDEFAKKFNEVS